MIANYSNGLHINIKNVEIIHSASIFNTAILIGATNHLTVEYT